MKKDLYEKLVDLYAGQELSAELNSELEQAAMTDPDLAAHMESMAQLVSTLHEIPAPNYSADSQARILRKIEQQAALEQRKEIPSYLQYPLPMQG